MNRYPGQRRMMGLTAVISGPEYWNEIYEALQKFEQEIVYRKIDVDVDIDTEIDRIGILSCRISHSGPELHRKYKKDSSCNQEIQVAEQQRKDHSHRFG